MRWSCSPPGGNRGALVVCVAVVLVLAGCSGIAGDTGLPEGKTAADRFTSLDAYSGTAEITYTGATSAENRTVELAVSPDTGESRVEIRAPPQEAGTVYVYNRSRIVRYNASENEVVYTKLSGVNRTARFQERIRTFVERANGDESGDRASVSPLPVVPEAGGGPGVGANVTRLSYSYEGTETVLGREAHVVHMEPANDSDSGILNQTLWLDTETFVSLKAHSVRQLDDQRVAYTFRFRNITFEPDLPDDTFTFDPPPGATVNESASGTRSVYDSRQALAAGAELSVPDPDLPEGFRLEYAQQTIGEDERQLALVYRRGATTLFVEKASPPSGEVNVQAGEPVRIGDREGRYVAEGAGAEVTWTCEGSRYTVGGGLERETLVSVAESMVCE